QGPQSDSGEIRTSPIIEATLLIMMSPSKTLAVVVFMLQ
ncbi:hypothetical protein V3C99_007520, partial [Haemonchus contortus]